MAGSDFTTGAFTPQTTAYPPVYYNAFTGFYNDDRSLLDLLTAGDPVAAIEAATIAAQVPQEPPTNAFITIYSPTYEPLGTLNDYIDLQVVFPRNRVGSATIVCKGTEPMATVLIGCWKTTIPITIEIGSQRWSGRVYSCDDTMSNRVNTLTLQCKSDYGWLDHILCWPSPAMPIELQFPSRALYLGGAITVVKTLIAEQALRLQSGIWGVIDDLSTLDFGEITVSADKWVTEVTELLSGENVADILGIPLVVVPADPITDTSPIVSISGRMDKLSTLIEQTATDFGLSVICALWLPGDPQPKGLVWDLTYPCIVVDVRDYYGVTGPTGTFFDGILQDVVDLQASILGNALAPLLNPSNEYAPPGINIAPTLGVNFIPPWTIFTDSNRDGLREYHVVTKTPEAYSMIGGGKSPKWLDDLINETLEWLVDSITIAIGITGIPSDILDGSLDDILLAFQELTNADRQKQMGPFGWPEHFVQTGSSAYTLDEWFALEGALWDTRGYPMFTLKFDNGFPYTIGVDVFPGQMVSFVRRGIMYTDYVDSVTFSDNRKTRMRVDMVAGDILPMQNPVVKMQRRLNEFEAAFQIITLSNN